MEQRKGFPYGALAAGLFGLAVGAALGLLFAPEEGRRSRTRLAGWLKEKKAASPDAKKAVEGLVESARRAFRKEKTDEKHPAAA